MTLTAVKVPQLLFSSNADELVLCKTGILDDTSGYAQTTVCLDDAAAPAAAETLVFELEDGSLITFTFSATLTDTPGNVPAYAAGSFDIYMQQLVQHIYRHPEISRNYYVEYLGHDAASGLALFLVRARRRGMAYNIEVKNTSTVNYDATNTVKTDFSTDDVALENFKLQARIVLINDYIYNATYTDVDNIEATGVVDADNDRMLITFSELPAIGGMKLGFDIPENFYLPLPHRKSFGAVQVELNSNTAGVTNKLAVQAFGDLLSDVQSNLILCGALPLELAPVEANFLAWAQFEVNNQQKFMTLQERRKIVTREQPEFLTYGIFQQFTYGVRFTVYYQDGTTASKLVNVDNVSSAMYCIPAGFDQNDLAALNPGGLTEVYYTVQGDFSPYNSEIFTYILEQRYFKENRYFIFKNPLGCIDTMRCYGVNKFTISKKGERNKLAITSQSRVNTGSIEMVYNEHEQTYTMRTGWLGSTREMEYWKSLLLSEYVGEVIMPLLPPVANETDFIYYKQPLRSIVVIDGSVDMFESNDNTWGLEWKMKYAHDDIAAAKMPFVPEVWFDNVIEFTVHAKALAGSDNVSVGVNAGNGRVLVNGVEQAIVAGVATINIAALGDYHIKVQASKLQSLDIIANSLTADLTITHIETGELLDWFIWAFDIIHDDYLVQRIPRLTTLRSFIIWSGFTDPGFSIDNILAALVQYERKGYGLLTTVDFSFSTPGAPGSLAKDILTNAGVTVTTL